MALEIPTTLAEMREKYGQMSSALTRARENSREERGTIAQLETALARTQSALGTVVQRTPQMVKPAVELGIMVGSAYGGGYVHEYLIEKGSEKIGPLPAVPVFGVAVALGGMFFADNPDIKEAALAMGAGLASVGAVDMGRKARKAHKTALDEMAAKAQQASKKS